MCRKDIACLAPSGSCPSHQRHRWSVNGCHCDTDSRWGYVPFSIGHRPCLLIGIEYIEMIIHSDSWFELTTKCIYFLSDHCDSVRASCPGPYPFLLQLDQPLPCGRDMIEESADSSLSSTRLKQLLEPDHHNAIIKYCQ